MARSVFIGFLLLFFGSISVFAQKDTLSGNVVEKITGEAVPLANVFVKDGNGKIVTFATTDSIGRFTLSVPTGQTGLTINASILGFKNYSAPLVISNKPILILLDDGTYQLKEVTVKGDRIRENGDTLTYNVATFAQKQDRTIGDVLKRMPGIDVRSDGRIQYQGQDINKFYIEGSDLLGGKYGVATNGISYDDVGAVDIMENHQPMQVLSGISFSEQAGINLRLKNKSKGTWLANGHVGGGYSNQPEGGLWDVDAFLMTARSKYQAITTFKSNNDGHDLTEETTDFLSNGRNTGIESYVELQLPSIPAFEKERSLFNRTHIFSTNHLWKSRNVDIKAQVDYSNNRITSSSRSVTTYYREGGDKVIAEESGGKQHANTLSGSFSIEANQKTYYLNNILKTEMRWTNLTTDMTGTVPNIQHADLPDYYAANNFKLIKRFHKNHLVTFLSTNEWESQPQNLTVTMSEGKGFSQHVGEYAFFSNESASYAFLFHGMRISMEGGMEAYLRNMNSGISGETGIDNTMNNDVRTNYLRIFLTPKIEYELKGFDFTISDPMNYSRYFMNQSIGNRSEYLHAPSLRIRWKPTGRMSLSIRGGINKSPISLHEVHDGLMAANYRSFRLGTDRFYTNKGKNLSGNFFYRNGSKGIFANALVQKAWNKTPYQSAQTFYGDYLIYSLVPSTASTQTVNALGNVSKTLDFMRGGISFTGSYRHVRTMMLSDNLPTLMRQSAYRFGGRVNGNVSTLLFLQYEGMFSVSSMNINGSSNKHIRNAIHKFNITLTPIQQLMLECGLDYYHNQEYNGSKKDFSFLDAKLTWTLSKVVDIELSATNLLNTKTYSYTTYGDLVSFSSTRYLRGREVMVSIYLKR